MEYDTTRLGRVFTVRLGKGEDILGALQELVTREGIKRGVILTGYGTVDRCCYHRVTTAEIMPTDEHLTVDAPLEILSIDGWVIEGGLHSHILVADRDRAFGGHLDEGTRVLYLCNLVLAELN
jgi:uncharacterized protein